MRMGAGARGGERDRDGRRAVKLDAGRQRGPFGTWDGAAMFPAQTERER